MKPCEHETYSADIPVIVGYNADGSPIVELRVMEFCRLCGRRLGGFDPGSVAKPETN